MKRILAVLAQMALLPALASAQDINFTAGCDAGYLFDNREFARSADEFIPSGTIHYVRATPKIGIAISEGETVTHRLTASVDLLKNAGEGLPVHDIFSEMNLYYQVDVKLDKGLFRAAAGSYPAALYETELSEAIFSREVMETDFNYEGMFLKYKGSRYSGELALDWMGMKGADRKERFRILHSSKYGICDMLLVGFDASMYHYAGSENAPGVVDNHYFNPYLSLGRSYEGSGFSFNLRAGEIISYQRDRKRSREHLTLYGFEGRVDLNWNGLGLRDVIWQGDNLQPYFYDVDLGGNLYGKMLYSGSQMYRNGSYNMTELYYAPKGLPEWIKLSVGCRFHFAGSYLGCDQRVSLVLNIDRIYE